jgi:hypothetical protein
MDRGKNTARLLQNRRAVSFVACALVRAGISL